MSRTLALVWSLSLVLLAACQGAPESSAARVDAAEAASDDPFAPDAWVSFLHPTRPEMVGDQTPEEAALVQEHLRYLAGLDAEGRIVAGGPTVEPPFTGVLIFRAASREAAEELAAGDPAVRGGVFRYRLAPMVLAFGSATR